MAACEDELASETGLVLHHSKNHFTSGAFPEKNNSSWLWPTGMMVNVEEGYLVLSLDEMNATTERQWPIVDNSECTRQ